MADLQVRVKKIKGCCPVYKERDTFFIGEGYKLRSRKSISMRSLASLMPYYVALNKDILPKSIGLGKEGVAYVQCLVPVNIREEELLLSFCSKSNFSAFCKLSK